MDLGYKKVGKMLIHKVTPIGEWRKGVNANILFDFLYAFSGLLKIVQ